jgi:hypothetical protein
MLTELQAANALRALADLQPAKRSASSPVRDLLRLVERVALTVAVSAGCRADRYDG